MIELEHSPLGGSGANRFMTCIGSFLKHREQLVAGTFENIESDFAKLGTAAHEVAAVCLQQHKEPYEFIGWTCGPYTVAVPSDASDPNTIDPNALAVYVNECERIYPRDGKGTAAIETTFHRPNIHPLLKGTVDFGYWSAKRGMHVRDYKNGEGIGVRAPNNKQLLYYGYVMAESYAWLGEGPKDLPVTLGIVQPNFYGVFEEPDVWETNLGTVLEWGRDELVPYMHKATQREHIDESDYVPGEHCQFCPVMLECPKAQTAYKALVGGASEIITLADGTDTIAMLSNEELDQYFGQRALARKFMNVLETTVKARALTGTKFEHAKIVEKQTHRIWKPGAESAIKAKFGDQAYAPKKIRSPAQIEKLSSDGKALALEFGFKPDANGYSIAGMDDRRPAAIPTSSNEKVFAGFEMKPPEFDL